MSGFVRRPLVYVAGSYSSDPVAGCRAAIRAADRLLGAGLAPVVPHLSLLWDLVSPHPAGTWYQLDWQVLARCDAVLRLPGSSTGSDEEARLAGELAIPVFCDVDELVGALLPAPPEAPLVTVPVDPAVLAASYHRVLLGRWVTLTVTPPGSADTSEVTGWVTSISDVGPGPHPVGPYLLFGFDVPACDGRPGAEPVVLVGQGAAATALVFTPPAGVRSPRRSRGKPAAAEAPQTECRGFQWLGQSMEHCERCGRPWHVHDGMERPVPGAGLFSDETFIEPWLAGDPEIEADMG